MFLVTLALNIIPYYLSRGASKTDGIEVAGWPLHFWVYGGGTVCTERIDAVAIVVDVLVALILPAGIGIAFRDGIGRFSRRTRILLRKSWQKARTWPRE